MEHMSHIPETSVSLKMAKLAWPIYVENLLRISLGVVDVVMLSWYSASAVAGVGLSNLFVMFMQLLYAMVAIGASIYISQNIGAGRRSEAGHYSLGAMAFGSVFAVLLSVAMAFAAAPIISCYKLEAPVHDAAVSFLFIIGSSSVFMALSQIQGTVLRAHGHSRAPMFVNMAANVTNIAGNALFIFGPTIGPIHVPVLGVTGVALSTVFSQFLSCVAMFVVIRKHRDILIPYRHLFRLPRRIYRDILSVGAPTAGENLSYNIGQIVIMSMIAQMGTAAMAAFVYVTTVARFIFMPSLSIGNATQITVGHLVGAGDPDTAQAKVYRWWIFGVGLSLVLVSLVNLFKTPILGLFHPDAATMAMASSILLVSILQEPGRNFNIIVIPALKGAGDVKFPVFMGMVFMWGVGVVLAWFLGVHLAWGLVGVWVALTVDEWVRGIIMLFRWRSGRWRSKALVAPPAAA